MKRIFIISCVFFALLTTANAGEMYRCVDRDGNSILSSYPLDGMKCVLRGSYRDPSPKERAQEQRESQRIRERQEYQREVQGMQEEVQRSQDREKQAYDAQRKRTVDLERKRLEGKKDNSSSHFGRERFNKAVDKRKEELEKDPEQYFYNKEQREKEAASRPKSGLVIDPRTGQVIQGIPLH
jgi:hypothetical protein